MERAVEKCKTCVISKQWPLAPNLRDLLITLGNVSRRVTFFSKMAFGECQRVWRVRAKQVGECQRVWWVRANQVGECRRVWRVLAKPLDECWHKKDRLFYAQITYFICIKRSSLHSLNLHKLDKFAKLAKFTQNLPFASLASPRKMVWRMSASLASPSKPAWRMSTNLASPTHFQKGSFWRVLEFDKFAVEWPLLSYFLHIKQNVIGLLCFLSTIKVWH